jgi:uncharacterized Zn-binding protein involved in type VI secretion
MTLCHRIGDLRACGALTTAGPNQTSGILVDGKPWAVNGDLDSHGAGALISTLATFITINGVPVVVVGDQASPDNLCPIPGGAHCAPYASSGSSLINVVG